MTNKQLIFSLLLVCGITNSSFAQTRDFSKYEHKHLFCEPWIGNNAFLTDYLNNIDYKNQEKPMYSIPVKIWVYGSKNNAPTENDIKETIQNLNELNQETKTLLTYYVTDIKYIRRKRFEEFGFYWNMPWQSIFRNDRNVLNISLVNRLKKPGKKNRNLDYTGVCFSPNQHVTIAVRNDKSVVTHEVGHAFGLKHPHHNYTKGKHNQESVDRDKFRGGIFKRGRNCEINGDGLYDTEAQPILTKYTDKNCNYTAEDKTDKWGVKYHPQLDNIMSYTTGKQCRRTFTQMQIAVMLYNASQMKFADKFKLNFNPENLNIGSLPDKYEYDLFNSPDCATTLKDKVCQEHTLHQGINKKGKVDNFDIDSFKFTVGKNVNKEKSKIIISNGKYANKDLKILVMADTTTVKEFTKKAEDENFEISLKDFKNGTYYLVISERVTEISNNVTSYNIMLDLDYFKL